MSVRLANCRNDGVQGKKSRSGFSYGETAKNLSRCNVPRTKGAIARDDTGAEGDGDVERISLLGGSPKFCSRSPVGIGSVSWHVMGPRRPCLRKETRVGEAGVCIPPRFAR